MAKEKKKKLVPLQVLVTPGERDQVKVTAYKSGKNLSNYLRGLLKLEMRSTGPEAK